MDSASNSLYRFLQGLVTLVALIVLAISSVVFAQRGVEAWRIAQIPPGVAITSGCEEESMSAIWRAIHGKAIYPDSSMLPYGSAYFNWLFYHGYAAWVRPVVKTCGDGAIVWHGRFLTAIGTIIGAVALGWLLARITPVQRLAAWSIGVFVFFGPLVGWWAHTLRPDIWAMVFETLAIVLLLVGWRKRPMPTLCMVGILFFAAWSMKPNYVLGIGSAVMFLSWKRAWRLAVPLAVTAPVLWMVSIAFEGEARIAMLLETPSSYELWLCVGWGNLVNALAKSLPLLVLGVTALVMPKQAEGDDAPSNLVVDAQALGFIGTLVAGGLGFVMSCKIGAWSNYFFTASLMACIWFAAEVSRTRSSMGWLLAGVTAVVLQISVLTGTYGRIDLHSQAHMLAERWQALHQYPPPRFSADVRLNLPWINPESPPLVLAFNYFLDRSAGRIFEYGGVGGMIEAGYFSTLLLPADTSGTYDSARLDGFEPVATVDDMVLYSRKSP